MQDVKHVPCSMREEDRRTRKQDCGTYRRNCVTCRKKDRGKRREDCGNLLPLLVSFCMLFSGCREETSGENPKVVETLPAVEIPQATIPAEESVTSPESAPAVATQPTTTSPTVEGVPAFQPL